MSVRYYQDMCMKNRGRAVEIRTRDGGVHQGVIDRMDENCVYLRPLRGADRLGGFGYGLIGFGFGIAFGAIASLAFLPGFYYW